MFGATVIRKRKDETTVNSQLDQFLGAPVDLPGGSDGNSKRPKFSKQRGGINKKVLFITLGVLLFIGVGFGVWKFIINDKPTEQPTTVTDSEPAEEREAEQISRDISATQDTETFRSVRPRLELTYPSNWEVSEQDGVRIKSPSFSYQTVDGTTVDGHFQIYIRQGARDVDSKYIGRGVAILPSETIAYSDPLPDQRAETNLSLFGIDSTDHFAYFLIAGNFELAPGDTLGPDYGREAEAYIITGGFSSDELEEDMQTHQVPVDWFQTSNAYQIGIDIIKSLKVF
jgi:hypothetical protein